MQCLTWLAHILCIVYWVLTGQHNETWSVVPVSDDDLFTTYGRPLYAWNGISYKKHNLTKDDYVHIAFVGDRWNAVIFRGMRKFGIAALGQWEMTASNFHPFWSYNYSTFECCSTLLCAPIQKISTCFPLKAHNEQNSTFAVSDPSTESTPVGVDFYEIGEQGKQSDSSWLGHDFTVHVFSQLISCVFHEKANSMALLEFYIPCNLLRAVGTLAVSDGGMGLYHNIYVSQNELLQSSQGGQSTSSNPRFVLANLACRVRQFDAM
jgi:hypothetical protein